MHTAGGKPPARLQVRARKEAESKFTRMLNDTDPQMQLAYANVLLDNFSDTKVVQENRESITKMKDSWESLQDMKKMRDNIGL